MKKFEAVHQLFFQCIDDHKLIYEELGWEKDSKVTPKVYPSFLKAVQRAEENENTSKATDIKFLKLVHDLLIHQSIETLLEKLSALDDRSETSVVNFFPNVLSKKDSLIWAREIRWSPVQAAMLSVGIVPNSILEYSYEQEEKLLTFATSSLIDEIEDRLRLIQKYSYSFELGDGTPLQFLGWFERMEFSFPKNLASAVNRIHGLKKDTSEETLSDNERNSLLKLIAAMSVRGYGFDPLAKRNNATKDIQSDMDFLGIPMDQKTILKWVRQATNMLDDEVLR